jgi:hypothetical protein
MKKRIGSKLYDTETSELIRSIEGGQLYQKRTRDREWFAVMDDWTIRPMPEMTDKPEPTEYRVRIDRETYYRIAGKAKAENCSMSEVIRELVSEL